jgi:hypothetical protein
MQTKVIVTLRVEGVHHWPGCPFDDVAFLKDKHRHIFHIKATKAVTHDDRDVEIIMLKREIEQYLFEAYEGDFDTNSCEMIAKDLVTVFKLSSCEVLEDGENGAIVESE